MRPDHSLRDRRLDEEQVMNIGIVGLTYAVTLRQVTDIARALEGLTLSAELWICTSFATREVLERMGLLALIEAAGGHVCADTCIDQPCWHHLSGRKGMTDSPKCSYYASMRGMDFVLGRLSECVEAAVSGRAS